MKISNNLNKRRTYIVPSISVIHVNNYGILAGSPNTPIPNNTPLPKINEEKRKDDGEEVVDWTIE